MSVRVLKTESNNIDNSTMPEYLERVTEAIVSEKDAIREYDTLLSTYDLPDDLINVITEIRNDEKDHIVLLSAILEKYSVSNFPDNTNELSEYNL